MKIFVILAFIILLDNALAMPFEDELQSVVKYCLKQEDITRSEIIEQDYLHKPTLKLKRFYACLLEKLEFLKDGILQEDIILQKSKTFQYPNFLKNCLRMCKHIKESDNFSTAYKLSSCFGKVDRKYFDNEWMTINHECKKEEKLSEKEYTKIRYFPIDNPTLAMKRYAICMFERQGLLRDNILLEDVILEITKDYEDAGYLKNFLSSCKEIHDDNRYDKAFKLFECLKKSKIHT